MAINCAIDLVPFHSLSKLKLADPAHVKVGFFFFFLIGSLQYDGEWHKTSKIKNIISVL